MTKLNTKSKKEKIDALELKESETEDLDYNDSKSKFDSALNYILLAVFILVVGVIVVSLFLVKEESLETFDVRWSKAMAGESGDGYYTYNGFPFARDDEGLWQTVVLQKFTSQGTLYSREVTLTMYYDPMSLDEVVIDGDTLEILKSSLLYTSFASYNNSMSAIAGVELRKIVGETSLLVKVPTKTAVYGSNPGTYPAMSCLNASNDVGVIEFRIGDSSSITGNSSCVVLTGVDDANLVAVADRYVYQILGIMK